MAKKKILVLTDDMPWGHRSIAKAIYGFLKGKEKEGEYQVDYAEVKANTGIAGDAYVFVYRYFPSSNRLSGWMSVKPRVRRLIEDLSGFNLPNLKRVVQRYKPDLIISAYWFHSQSLAKWREEDKGVKFKLWTIVADPWTIMPVSFVSKADLNLVYDEVGEKLALKYGVEEDKVLKTGWWVRQEMYQKADRERVRKKLGFNDKRPVVFVGGGSLGTNSLTRLLPALMLIKGKAGFIFNTGTDKFAYNLVEEYIKLFKSLKRNDNIIIKNMGWIENMGEVLSAADIVFGKAGPNFLFDCVAREKAFVAITHIGGQEDGNIELIKKKGLGWVKEKRNEAADFLLKYLEKPKKYNKKCQENVSAESRRNRKSMEMLWRRVKKEIPAKS